MMAKSASADASRNAATGLSRRMGLACGLIAIAMAVAVYLLHAALTRGLVSGCGPGSPCERVLASRWAWWFGVPVSGLGLVIYSTFLLSVAGLRRANRNRKTAALAGSLLLSAAAAILAAGLWFIGLQWLAIKSFCHYCLVAHGCGIAAALLSFGEYADFGDQAEKANYGETLKLPLFLGGAVTLLLIVGQLAYETPTYQVKSIHPEAPTNKVLSGTFSNASITQSQTIVSMAGKASAHEFAGWQPDSLTGVATTHGGRFQYNLREVPIMGPPEAPLVAVHLYDYTCRHCRVMHGQLLEACAYFSNRLAVICLPAPLDAECNRLVVRTQAASKNACQFARLGLAVWRADRKRYREFDNWMFGQEQIPSLNDAMAYAVALVGADNLGRAVLDKWVDEQLAKGVSIYHTNLVLLNNGHLPQLIMGSQVALGSFPSTKELIRMVETVAQASKAKSRQP